MAQDMVSMAGGFAVRVLGRGSIAAYLKLALDIAWVVLWAAAGALALGVFAYICILVMVGVGALPDDILKPGERVFPFGPVTLQTDEGESLVPALIIPVFVACGVAVSGALIIVLRLKLLFKSFTSGEPFSRENATHLRIIWITMLVMELSRYVLWGIVNGLVTVFGHPEGTEVHVSSPINWMTWGAILILIVLAEVFREGARLREEQELTI
jgi:Protein of unknown function (DUF2975)